jgi:hypothetical protein
MAEPVRLWWARRQFSRDAHTPYPVGTYRDAWAPFPELIKQYHPDLNDGIVLSQIPPAADVLLCWQCETGHRFAATPTEQRNRPGRKRRRSAWCPECTAAARPTRMPLGEPAPRRAKPPARPICDKTPALPPGTPFHSACAPLPASAVEDELRAALTARLTYTPGYNAVRVSRPFFQHLEVWPDILLPELRVAIEYDSTGRHGLEHVGKRETADRWKDRALRHAGWEVIRIRTGKLQPLGPHDIQATSITRPTINRILDQLREIRGTILVDAYSIGPHGPQSF